MSNVTEIMLTEFKKNKIIIPFSISEQAQLVVIRGNLHKICLIFSLKVRKTSFSFCDCFNFLLSNLSPLYIVCILHLLNLTISRFGGVFFVFFLDFILDFSYPEVGLVTAFMKYNFCYKCCYQAIFNK